VQFRHALCCCLGLNNQPGPPYIPHSWAVRIATISAPECGGRRQHTSISCVPVSASARSAGICSGGVHNTCRFYQVPPASAAAAFSSAATNSTHSCRQVRNGSVPELYQGDLRPGGFFF
jgi:hypothetical protein